MCEWIFLGGGALSADVEIKIIGIEVVGGFKGNGVVGSLRM